MPVSRACRGARAPDANVASASWTRRRASAEIVKLLRPERRRERPPDELDAHVDHERAAQALRHERRAGNQGRAHRGAARRGRGRERAAAKRARRPRRRRRRRGGDGAAAVAASTGAVARETRANVRRGAPSRREGATGARATRSRRGGRRRGGGGRSAEGRAKRPRAVVARADVRTRAGGKTRAGSREPPKSANGRRMRPRTDAGRGRAGAARERCATRCC